MATLRRRHRQHFYSRVIVPTNLREVLGRREIQKSLGTESQTLASLRGAVWEGHVASLFLHLQHHKEHMTEDEIAALTQHWLSTQLEVGEEDRRSRTVGDDERDAISLALSDALEDTWLALIQNNYRGVVPDVDALLASHHTALPKDSEAYHRLCREVLKAKQGVLRIEMDRWNGNYRHTPHPAPQRTTAPSLGPSLSFPEAVTKYMTHNAHRAPGTLRAKQDVLKRFAEVVGEKSVRTYTKQDCIAYRGAVSHLPLHIGTRYPGKTALEVLALVKDRPEVPRLSKQTVNQDLVHLSHFFSWLIDEGYHAGPNPVEGLQYEGIEAEHHDPFTKEELTRIFSAPTYAATLHANRPERFWLPLISLYSGARRGEIAGLAVGDIRTEHGVWFFDITPDTARGRRLKNKASKRRVPIHSHLIALGFLDFVKRRKDAGESLLFPKRTDEGRTSVDDAVGKWLARLLRSLGITSGKKSFHSFRSTVITALHAAGVDGETRRAITGHGGKDVHEAVYLQPALPTLKEATEKLDFRPVLKGLENHRVNFTR